VAFDLMDLNGHDLRDMPLARRREILQALIPEASAFNSVRHCPVPLCRSFISSARFEGMVSKRKDSVYRSGNSTAWLKTKSYAVDEYDLLGVEREAGKPAIALIAERGTGRYVGAVFINSNRELREPLWARVQDQSGPARRE
jgi:bifunctional non-homologous end joining protein LigD